MAVRRGRVWRWTKRIVLGTVALTVIAIVTLLIVLHTDYGRGIVRSQVESRLAEIFTGGASIGKVEGSPLGELVVSDVVLYGPDRKPAITIKTLTLEIRLRSLLSHRVQLSSVVGSDIRIDLTRDDHGDLQAANLLAPIPRSRWSFDVPDIEAHRIQIALDSGDQIVHLDDIELVGSVLAPVDEPVDVILRARGRWREPEATFELVGHVTPTLFEIPGVVMHAASGEIAAAGVRIEPQPGQLPTFAGLFDVTAQGAAIERLVPALHLPHDVNATISLTPVTGQPTTLVGLAGKLGDTTICAGFTFDLEARRAVGKASIGELDLALLARLDTEARAGGAVTFDLHQGKPGQLPVGQASFNGSGHYGDLPQTTASGTLSSTGDRVTAAIVLDDVEAHATLGGELRKVGETIVLEHGTVVATTRDPARSSGRATPLHGTVAVDLAVSGTVLPHPDLAIIGTGTGKRLRLNDLAISSLTFAIDASHLPARPAGKLSVEAVGVERGDILLRDLKLTAANRADGKIVVSLRSHPKQAPWVLDVDGLVTLGDVVTVELASHRIRAGNGIDWAGSGGRLTMTDQQIELRDFTSTSHDGALAITGTFGRTTGDIVAKVDGTGIAFDTLNPTYTGTIDAHLAISRRRGRFEGTAAFAAKGFATQPSNHPIDAAATLALHGGELVVDGTASSPKLGALKLSFAVDAPANLVDATAWLHLHRNAIRNGKLALTDIDVAPIATFGGLDGTYAGRIVGELLLSATTAGGAVQLRDFVIPQLPGLGKVSGRLQISQNAAGELTPTIVSDVDGIGKLVASARLQLPDHPFDPAAWRGLGRGMLRSASLIVDGIELEPGLFERLGIETSARGKVTIAAQIGDGARTAKLDLAVHELHGSPITQPLELGITASIGDTTTVTLTVATLDQRLVTIDGTIPVTLAELVTSPKAVLAKPLKLSARLPAVPAKRLLAVFGRNEIAAGTIEGTVEIAGTIGRPTVVAKLVGVDLAVPPNTTRPVPVLKRIVFEATWDGAAGKLVVDGTQEGGTLHVEAHGTSLADARVELDAKRFDMMAVLAFMPGPAGGAAGKLDAHVVMTGLDPRTAKLAGDIHLVDARIPISPSVGTLYRAKIDLVVHDRDIAVAVDGRLGGGTVKVTGTIARDGNSPTDLIITLRKVSPIGIVEPTIDADVTLKLHREDQRWIADIDVRKGKIVVPSDRGEKLKEPGAPTDMVFMNGERMTHRPMKKAPPTRPVIVANITLWPASLESEEVRGIVRGKVVVTADGESIGLVGDVQAVRASLDLFSRRYRVERAIARFDGTTDPLLDVIITHDFPEVTTTTQVRGRLATPELIMSSNPNTYSQSQLLGFLLGGEPSGDVQDPSDRASAVGMSYVANKIGGYMRRALPFDVDVIRYDNATTLNSAAITVGTWVTGALFVAFRAHPTSRSDENTGEGAVEYWLSRRMVVEAVAGDRSIGGLDLLWRRRY